MRRFVFLDHISKTRTQGGDLVPILCSICAQNVYLFVAFELINNIIPIVFFKKIYNKFSSAIASIVGCLL